MSFHTRIRKAFTGSAVALAVTLGASAASAQETERILAWLEHAETRLVETSGDWVSPARGAARFSSLLTRAEAAASGKD